MSYAHSNNYIRKDLYQPEENEYDDLKFDDNNEYSELTSRLIHLVLTRMKYLYLL